jgi:hypothetical protein
MLKKLLAGVAGVAAVAFAGSAMAQQIDDQNYGVDVNISVAEIVSLWGFEDVISLVFQGNDGNNTSFHDTSFSYLNNTTAAISVTVEGDLGDPANDVNFYVADSAGAAVQAAMLSNAYAPGGVGTVLRWEDETVEPDGGTTQTFKNVPVSINPTVDSFSYLINAPGGSGGAAGDNYALAVTWTITDTP